MSEAHPPAPEPPAPEPAALERWLLLGLCAATAVYWIPQFRAFWLPNNDFGTFDVVARAFARGELPTNLQRLPLFPASMALLAPLLPGRHPTLDAALLLNVAFALGTLPLLYAFAARTLGAGALLVPVLLAGTAQFHVQALQPLVEPSLGFFVVLAFVLFQRGSPWQYAAAGAAALSRYEAAALLGLFALAGGLRDGRWLRHAALATLAGLPFALWLALGALRGSGAAFYAADMGRMGFEPAPHALATLLKEAFRGWWSDAPGPDLPLFLLCAALPTLAGVALGWRRFRRETILALVYLALTLAVIVGLGIDKARYVYPVLWIPLLFFAAGVLGLVRSGIDGALSRLPPWTAAATYPALACFVLVVYHWVELVRRAPHEVVSWNADLLYLFAVLSATAVALAVWVRAAARGRSSPGAPLVVALTLVAALLFGGLRAKASEQAKVHWANYGVVLSAQWLEQHLAPDERFVAMDRQHYLFLTGFAPDRIVPFYDLDADGPAALAAEMRAKGLRYLVANWRKPVAQRIDAVYERKFKWFLVDPFAQGAPVAGFEHVTALELPAALELPPVQIYRLAP